MLHGWTKRTKSSHNELLDNCLSCRISIAYYAVTNFWLNFVYGYELLLDIILAVWKALSETIHEGRRCREAFNCKKIKGEKYYFFISCVKFTYFNTPNDCSDDKHSCKREVAPYIYHGVKQGRWTEMLWRSCVQCFQRLSFKSNCRAIHKSTCVLGVIFLKCIKKQMFSKNSNHHKCTN